MPTPVRESTGAAGRPASCKTEKCAHSDCRERCAIGNSRHGDFRERCAIGKSRHSDFRERCAIGNSRHGDFRQLRAIENSHQGDLRQLRVIGNSRHGDFRERRVIGNSRHSDFRQFRVIVKRKKKSFCALRAVFPAPGGAGSIEASSNERSRPGHRLRFPSWPLWVFLCGSAALRDSCRARPKAGPRRPGDSLLEPSLGPRRAALLPLALLLAGCPSLSTYQTADPLPPGAWELGAQLDGVVLEDTEQQTRSPSAQLALSARRGLVEDLDAGLKLYTLGADTSLRWRLLNGDWRLALAPTFGMIRTTETATTTDALHFFAQLPLPVTRDLSSRLQLTFGPRLVWGLYWPETGGQAQGWLAGGFCSLAIRLGDSWLLVPELSLHGTLDGEVPLHGRWTLAGLGLLWRPGQKQEAHRP